MKLTIRDIVRMTGARLVRGSEDLLIEAVSIDSRELPPHSLFVAIKGERSDGHLYAAAALQRGADAILVENLPEAKELSEGAVLLVESTVQALQKLASEYRKERLSLPILAVSGSVGKTSTRELIAAALKYSFRVYKTKKNYNNYLGLPLSILDIQEEDEVAVLELGMNVPGELGLISEIASPDIAVLTNIGSAHMEFYGSEEGILREKLTITKGMKKGSVWLNADDHYLGAVRKEDLPTDGELQISYFGEKDTADARILSKSLKDAVYSFTLGFEGKKYEFSLSVLGVHNVWNAAVAAAIALRMGASYEDVRKGLKEYRGFPGRLFLIPRENYQILDDTYNASAASMKAGIRVVEGMQGVGPKILVLADMKELGERSESLHREVGAFLADKSFSAIYLVGTEVAHLRDEARKHGLKTPMEIYPTWQDLYPVLKTVLKDHALLYLKGSHSMGLSHLVDAL